MAAAVRPVDAILTRTQQRVLALLFSTRAECTLSELVRRSGGGSGAIRREVERMTAAGLLRVRRVGNQRRFSADRASPLFPALAVLAAQTAEPAARGVHIPGVPSPDSSRGQEPRARQSSGHDRVTGRSR